jgi:hypothetical protein|tara:strand:- start:566 stop:1417 length:852 start_codon:yes stop_codon:yes gene_type:complete
MIGSYCLGKKKDYGLDQFYTNSDIAKKCIDTIDVSKYDIVVEPSAGMGAFYNLIDHPNKIGVDIEPKCSGVIKQDFLQWDLNEFPLPKVLTIGNPPFGRQGSSAMKFIKHASIFSTTIAFILPRGFKKRSVYDRVPLNFWKVNEIGIPENSFIYNGEPFDVPCVWMEYEKKNKLRTKEKKLTPKTFRFTTQEDANVSIRRVGVNAGKTSPYTGPDTYSENDTSYTVSKASHYFIKVDNVDEFVNKVNQIKFSDGDTTGPRSISKNELIGEIENATIYAKKAIV